MAKANETNNETNVVIADNAKTTSPESKTEKKKPIVKVIQTPRYSTDKEKPKKGERYANT